MIETIALVVLQWLQIIWSIQTATKELLFECDADRARHLANILQKSFIATRVVDVQQFLEIQQKQI